ncbi:MAG: ATP-dependent endonuclease [Nocardioidaceae bacterium]|nr:ATP-dependent endonuclease [Nocardioidaceae bacterium]
MRNAVAEAVVLVEGESDRVALATVAALLGRDLVGVRIEVLGGATNAGRVLGTLGEGTRVLGLYDEPEERWFCNGLQRAGFGKVHDRDDLETLGFFACIRDLEDELIRALGATRVRDVIEVQGELASLLTLQRQPAQRERTPEQQLHRFIGTRSGRKALYARLLAEALVPEQVPRPLASLLSRL